MTIEKSLVQVRAHGPDPHPGTPQTCVPPTLLSSQLPPSPSPEQLPGSAQHLPAPGDRAQTAGEAQGHRQEAPGGWQCQGGGHGGGARPGVYPWICPLDVTGHRDRGQEQRVPHCLPRAREPGGRWVQDEGVWGAQRKVGAGEGVLGAHRGAAGPQGSVLSPSMCPTEEWVRPVMKRDKQVLLHWGYYPDR